MRFKMMGDESEPEIVWTAAVDEEGDFCVYANGTLVLLIDAGDGELYRGVKAKSVQGLKTGPDGRITIAK